MLYFLFLFPVERSVFSLATTKGTEIAAVVFEKRVHQCQLLYMRFLNQSRNKGDASRVPDQEP